MTFFWLQKKRLPSCWLEIQIRNCRFVDFKDPNPSCEEAFPNMTQNRRNLTSPQKTNMPPKTQQFQNHPFSGVKFREGLSPTSWHTVDGPVDREFIPLFTRFFTSHQQYWCIHSLYSASHFTGRDSICGWKCCAVPVFKCPHTFR